MFRFSQKGAVTYVESDILAKCDFLQHAFCTRREGVSPEPYASLNIGFQGENGEGDIFDNIKRNKAIIADAFGFSPEQFLFVNQVHGDDILIIDDAGFGFSGGKPLIYDAIITNRPGLAICIKTADCTPVFIVDKKNKYIASVHAGWRGTARKIVAKVIDVLIDRCSSVPGDIIAVIGPSIGPCCYEVDRAVFDAAGDDCFPRSVFQSCRKEGKWMLDLPLANKIQIIAAGIPEKNIFVASVCTACLKDMFYSYRAEGGKTGRQLNYIMLNQAGASDTMNA